MTDLTALGGCRMTRPFRDGLFIACEGFVLRDGLCAHHLRMKTKPCAEGEHDWNEADDCRKCGATRINAGVPLEETMR